MTTLTRRLDRVEKLHEKTWLRPMRERVHRVMQRLGGSLPSAQVEDIVVRYARAELWVRQRIDDLRAKGLTTDEIVDRLVDEMAAEFGVNPHELKAEAERIAVDAD